MATPKQNYIDEKGNYHNIENLTLTQIHDRGVEEGYRIAKDKIDALEIELANEKLKHLIIH